MVMVTPICKIPWRKVPRKDHLKPDAMVPSAGPERCGAEGSASIEGSADADNEEVCDPLIAGPNAPDPKAGVT